MICSKCQSELNIEDMLYKNYSNTGMVNEIKSQMILSGLQKMFRFIVALSR